MGLDVAASILVVLVLRCNRSVKPIMLRRYNGGYALPVPCLILEPSNACLYSSHSKPFATRRHMGLAVAASILVVLVLCCNRSV